MGKLVWSGLLLVLLLSGCGSSGTPTRPNDFTPLTSIEVIAVTPSIEISKTIASGTSTRLSVQGNRSGLFTSDVTAQATWTSDSPAVAGFVTATEPSRVTGLAPGTAILTATVGSLTANFTLTVSTATVTSLTIAPAAPTVAKGLSTQFSVSGLFSDATTQDLTIDATWASSAPTVASVSDVAGSKGLSRALAAGATTISATFGGISGTTLMTVTEPVLQSITVTPANPSILTLSTQSFKATGNFSDGSTSDITSQVAWSSSQTGFASITAAGTASALTQGTTTIGATLSGVSGSTSLKVTGGNLTSIALTSARATTANNLMTLVNGTVVPLTATGSFSNGTNRDITGLVAWSTGNQNIATVTTATPADNLALLSALAVTPATTPTTVKATSGSINATINLTVRAPALTSLTLSTSSLALTAGTSDRLTLTATFNDGTSQDVTASSNWTSNAAAIATVGNSATNASLGKGRVRGVSAGTATISAAFGNRTVTTQVTVTARTIQSLAITSPGAVSGSQAKFIATATYSDLTSKDVTEDATWTIDKPFVAILADSLNQPGQVIGVDSGSAILTASFGGKTQTATVTLP